MAQYIDRFGVQAVLGRTLYLDEIKNMTIAQNTYYAYQSRAQSEDLAKWSSENPELARILSEARHG